MGADISKGPMWRQGSALRLQNFIPSVFSSRGLVTHCLLSGHNRRWKLAIGAS